MLQGSKGNDAHAAESVLAFNGIKKHNSYACTDCIRNFTKKIFPGSNTARRLIDARKKTYAIWPENGIISRHATKIVKVSMAVVRFCGMAADASKQLTLKMLPCLIQ